MPNVLEAAINCQRFGADGITVHPRPDQRHITKKDVAEIQSVITTEFNIEGYPSADFIEMVLDIKPNQVTLVPDGVNVLTSCAGWDTVSNKEYLKKVIKLFKKEDIRTSIFVDPEISMVEGAKLCDADRIELYTEDYSKNYSLNKKKAIKPYILAAEKASKLGLGINAGHDLNLENLAYFAQKIKNLDEVSIGHALISDALYLGLENTVQLYKRLL